MHKGEVANAGDTAVELVAAVEYPLGSESNPIMIGSAEQLSEIKVAAGSSTYLAVSSMLNGNAISIKGDSNTVVVVNGQTVTAKNGVFTAELNGGRMNQVIVTNNGTADAAYVAAIGDPIPATGDAMMALPMILALVSVMALGAVVVCKKKAF